MVIKLSLESVNLINKLLHPTRVLITSDNIYIHFHSCQVCLLQATLSFFVKKQFTRFEFVLKNGVGHFCHKTGDDAEENDYRYKDDMFEVKSVAVQVHIDLVGM